MSKKHMGIKNVRTFDDKLSGLLMDHSIEEGLVRYKLQTSVAWGRPLS